MSAPLGVFMVLKRRSVVKNPAIVQKIHVTRSKLEFDPQI